MSVYDKMTKLEVDGGTIGGTYYDKESKSKLLIETIPSIVRGDLHLPDKNYFVSPLRVWENTPTFVRSKKSVKRMIASRYVNSQMLDESSEMGQQLDNIPLWYVPEEEAMIALAKLGFYIEEPTPNSFTIKIKDLGHFILDKRLTTYENIEKASELTGIELELLLDLFCLVYRWGSHTDISLSRDTLSQHTAKSNHAIVLRIMHYLIEILWFSSKYSNYNQLYYRKTNKWTTGKEVTFQEDFITKLKTFVYKPNGLDLDLLSMLVCSLYENLSSSVVRHTSESSWDKVHLEKGDVLELDPMPWEMHIYEKGIVLNNERIATINGEHHLIDRDRNPKTFWIPSEDITN